MTKSTAAFEFTDDDLKAIALAQKEAKPWDSKHVVGLRSRLKKHNEELQSHMCCYCRCEQTGEFEFCIDGEHVLPKGKFPKYEFDIMNLSASCKRCNMNIKRERTDFIVDTESVDSKYKESSLYKLIHPNLDTYSAHLGKLSQSVDERRIIKYVIRDEEKGGYTYEFFRLKELEINSYDAGQLPGIAGENELVTHFMQVLGDLEEASKP